ncbi:MAG: Transcription initiation factor TFIID subunit 9 [Bathelium mastoideum]|nr:MAG: Transcription initiation factor TFIID subunit 9 [Bathelium mastoideum]KAI9690039.1 MAG: Transcription initiation factor TFIID subunit 9 [Bathelium mastoideum]
MNSPADAPVANGINGTSTPVAAGATSPPNQTSAANGISATDTQAPSLAIPTTSLDDLGTSRRPRDARLIHLILANLGVNAYQERVPLMLMDFAYRYTSGVLSDAMHISTESAPSGPGNPRSAPGADGGVTLDAVRQAIASRLNYQFNSVLPKEFQLELAAERNRIALPKPDKEFGVRLPPERYCLTGVEWQMKEEWDQEHAEYDEEDGIGLRAAAGNDTEMGEGGGEEEEDIKNEFEEVMGGEEHDSEMRDV